MLSIVQYLFYPVRTTWQLFILRGAVFFRCGAQLLDVSGGVSKVEIRHRQLLVIVLPLAAQSNPVFISLTHSHPLRSGILALCNKRWLEVFLRNRVEFTAVFELTLDLLNYGLSPFVQQFQ